MAIVTYSGKHPMPLISPAKLVIRLMPGATTEVPDEVWDRYKGRADIHGFIDRGTIKIGAVAARLNEDMTDKSTAKLRKQESGTAPKVNMAALSNATKAELVKTAKDLGLDLDEKMPKEDFLAAIRTVAED